MPFVGDFTDRRIFGRNDKVAGVKIIELAYISAPGV